MNLFKFTLFSALLFTFPVQAENQNGKLGRLLEQVNVGLGDLKEEFKGLPSDALDEIMKQKMSINTQISESIFKSVSDLDLGKVNLGQGIGFDVRSSRRVYSNNTINESYTVVDTLIFPVSIPSFSVPLGGPNLTFNIGFNSSFAVSNIRQVYPGNVVFTPELVGKLFGKQDLEKRRELLNKSQWMKQALDSDKDLKSGQPPDYYVQEDKGQSMFFLDGLRQARYGSLWNEVAFPLRIPLRAQWLTHIENNEIITYEVNGTIEAGPSAGVSTTVDLGGLSTSINSEGEKSKPTLGISAGISARLFVGGRFRISIYKVDENRVKVKITRAKSRGNSLSVGLSSELNLYPGYVISTKIAGQNIRETVADFRFQIIPFQISRTAALGDSFEVGYLFDLRDLRAQEAYESTLLGFVSKAEDLISQYEAANTDHKSDPVQKIFTKRHHDKTIGKSAGTKIILSASLNSSQTVIDEDITLRDEDGNDDSYFIQKYAAQEAATREWNYFLFSSKETANFDVRTDYIQNKETNQENIGLVASGQIYDSSTKGSEMNIYSERIERIFLDPASQKTIFPRVPEYTTVPNKEIKNWTKFGRALYYFQVGLSLKHLLAFANTNDAEMGRHLEIGFGKKAGTWNHTPNFFQRTLSILRSPFNWGIHSNSVVDHLGADAVAAARFRELWRTAKIISAGCTLENANDGSGSCRDFAKAIGQMYFRSPFTYELLATTMSALRAQKVEDISYRISARSSAFNSIEAASNQITEVEQITAVYNQATTYDTVSTKFNPNYQITNLNMDLVSGNPVKIKVTYEASARPDYLVVRLEKVSSILNIERDVVQLLIPNRKNGSADLFKSGANEFIIANEENNISFATELAHRLEPGGIYRINVGMVVGNASGNMAESSPIYINKLKLEDE
jgi:hypothetical protein